MLKKDKEGPPSGPDPPFRARTGSRLAACRRCLTIDQAFLTDVTSSLAPGTLSSSLPSRSPASRDRDLFPVPLPSPPGSL